MEVFTSADRIDNEKRDVFQCQCHVLWLV